MGLDGDKLTKAAAKPIKALGLKQPKDADITIAKGKPKIVASVASNPMYSSGSSSATPAGRSR